MGTDLYREVTAHDLLRWIDKTHPTGGNGNCLCPTCDAYGLICYAVGQITKGA